MKRVFFRKTFYSQEGIKVQKKYKADVGAKNHGKG